MHFFTYSSEKMDCLTALVCHVEQKSGNVINKPTSFQYVRPMEKINSKTPTEVTTVR